MAWYNEAVFYHIYPLGALGAPKQNEYSEPVHRLRELFKWIPHLKEMHFNALYIGPLFESVGHGYETTDYMKLDSRLGTNEDLSEFVKACHDNGIKVIFDGVFNHTGRDFFAFKDILTNRENSPYRDWYCNVNFYGNNEYNDGFSYDNWGGHNLLVKLNQRNPAVQDYICSVIRFWVEHFDIDGIRLDAADVLDFEFMKLLRRTTDVLKPEFWLMGEVIHGDYSRWANNETLHSVTNYSLHKALYSGHNDKNYFEIAHTIKHNNEMVPGNIRLYNFVDNHDVERIMTKLSDKANYTPVHILLYTLSGIPSVYYGSEFGIEGKKERFSDDSLRPAIDISQYSDAIEKNPCTKLLERLGDIHEKYKELSNGDYRELCLKNEQFAFARGDMIIAVNNVSHEAGINVEAHHENYIGLLSGTRVSSNNGRLDITLSANSGEIFAPETAFSKKEEDLVSVLPEINEVKETTETTVSETEPKEEIKEAPKEEPKEEIKPEPKEETTEEPKAEVKEEPKEEPKPVEKIPDIPYSEMSVEQLQEVILGKMAKNGPVTDRMRRDVLENVWHDSLVKWAESFR
ncbi:MAG: alpha-amylase [Lachnospiraceae bacterium]|nr:alpha-amylase [Lachnospiraceae bacterium]